MLVDTSGGMGFCVYDENGKPINTCLWMKEDKGFAKNPQINDQGIFPVGRCSIDSVVQLLREKYEIYCWADPEDHGHGLFFSFYWFNVKNQFCNKN